VYFTNNIKITIRREIKLKLFVIMRVLMLYMEIKLKVNRKKCVILILLKIKFKNLKTKSTVEANSVVSQISNV
jgi:hypothetical protein